MLATSNSHLKIRVVQAKKLGAAMDRILGSFEKYPKFKGKARLMDAVIKAQRQANVLASNLALDLQESQEINK